MPATCAHFFHNHPEHHARHALAAVGHEQVIRLLPGQDGAARLLQVALQPAARFFAKRHQTLLVAFAHHAQHAFVQPHLKGLERDQFRHAQAAGIHQLQHGAVAQAQGLPRSGGAEQGLHMGLRQGFGHPQGLACSLQAQGGSRVMRRSRKAQ